MSSVHHDLSVALASAFLAGACDTPAARNAVPVRVAADLTLAESAAAARVRGEAGDAGVVRSRCSGVSGTRPGGILQRERAESSDSDGDCRYGGDRAGTGRPVAGGAARRRV